MKQLIKRAVGKFRKTPVKISYSQCGEDLILEDACTILGIQRPTYLDVGANHPKVLNNTFLLYSKGSTGVLVEPNPNLASLLRKVRPRDMVLSCGVGGAENESLPFHVLSNPFLSSFSRSEAEIAIQATGCSLLSQLDIPLRTIGSIIDKEMKGVVPDIISMDVEGMDEEIIRSIDWSRLRPPLVCVETREFTNNADAPRIPGISETLLAANYGVFGLTYCNSIFVDLRRYSLV